jgi:hypothetical protein
VKLRNSFDLSHLIAGHCDMHILHNVAKNGKELLSSEVEILVIKVLNEFSSSPK